HRRHVAEAVARLEDAQVAAAALGVARTERREELVRDIGIAQEADRLTAGVQAAALAERDQLLDDRTQVLRLVQRGRDLLVLDESAGEIHEHRLAMLGGAVELPAAIVMTHDLIPLQRPSTALPAASPFPRCCPAASPGFPCPGGGPCRPALP